MLNENVTIGRVRFRYRLVISFGRFPLERDANFVDAAGKKFHEKRISIRKKCLADLVSATNESTA
jgi:hypothetical protein